MAVQEGGHVHGPAERLNHRIDMLHEGCRFPSFFKKKTCRGRRMAMHMIEEKTYLQFCGHPRTGEEKD